MKNMENGSRSRTKNSSSSSNSTTKRGKSLRKLQWKNYLNHLLKLWLYCGNISVDGWNYGESSAVNLYNKSNSTSLSDTSFTTPIRIRSFKPSSESNARSNESHKSFHKTSELSNFNRTGLNSVSPDDSVVAYSDFNINASNKTSLSEKIFHLIKSPPERGWGFSGKSINHQISSDHSSVIATHKGPLRLIKPENIVNTTRIINDAESIKHTQSRTRKSASFLKNITAEGENKLSIHYNQSSFRNSQQPRNPADRNTRKKLKSVTKNSNNSTAKSSSNRKKLSQRVSLLGLFEMTTHLGTRWEGKSELAAAQLAVKHINERGLLPGYILELITNDTQVTKTTDMRFNPLHQFFNLVNFLYKF